MSTRPLIGLAAAALALVLAPSCGLFRARPPVYPAMELPSGLVVQDLVVPTDPALAVAEEGDLVSLHYLGRIQGGDVFDSSFERGEPVRFRLGAGDVFAGLEQGIVGMRERGRRRLTVPPHLAFGDEGVPGRVPPEATLVIDVDLLDVEERGWAPPADT